MSIDDAKAVKLALSRDRLSTYPGIAKARSTEQAIRLYVWSGQVSGALMLPQQVCEVVVLMACVAVLPSPNALTSPLE